MVTNCKIISNNMGVESEVQQKVAKMAVCGRYRPAIDGNRTKDFADIVAEEKSILRETIQLFEQYIARDKAAVKAAR